MLLACVWFVCYLAEALSLQSALKCNRWLNQNGEPCWGVHFGYEIRRKLEKFMPRSRDEVPKRQSNQDILDKYREATRDDSRE